MPIIPTSRDAVLRYGVNVIVKSSPSMDASMKQLPSVLVRFAASATMQIF
jgi:hypothetical protein